MPHVSAKRQITLPADQCRQVGIGPGDEESLEDALAGSTPVS